MFFLQKKNNLTPQARIICPYLLWARDSPTGRRVALEQLQQPSQRKQMALTAGVTSLPGPQHGAALNYSILHNYYISSPLVCMHEPCHTRCSRRFLVMNSSMPLMVALYPSHRRAQEGARYMFPGTR